MKKYKVRWHMDNTYVVVIIHSDDEDDDYTESEPVYQGSLADCEAYIRLKDGGYM